MRIALSSAGFSEFSAISSSLGKCPTFLVYDFESHTYECIENKARLEEKSNGPKAIQFLKDKNVDGLITFHIGRNAFNEAKISNFPIYICNQGEIIKNALNQYVNNGLFQLESYDSYNKEH